MAEGDVSESVLSAAAERERALLALGHGGCAAGPARGYYYPLAVQGRTYGALGEAGEDFLALVARQAAQALRVQALAAHRQEALVMTEAEKARNSFLRGISHDLRTPLTGIIGASGTLLESGGELPPATQLHLIDGIHADAQWLLSMVENILSVTRIHQNGMAITKREEAMEEVVGEAVSIFRRRHPRARIAVRQLDSLLLAPMDPLLITQVLNNLLDNACRYAGETAAILIDMAEQDGHACLTVSDDGPGIAPEAMGSLFDHKPPRAGRSEDAARGHGMGLSICKTIIEAHGGWIRACNRPEGGACIAFGLAHRPGGRPWGINRLF